MKEIIWIVVATAFVLANVLPASADDEDDDDRSASQTFVLLDSDPLGPKEIGTVYGIEFGFNVNTRLTVYDSFRVERSVSLTVSRFGGESIFSSVGAVYFLRPDCGGPPYLLEGTGFPPAFDAAAVVVGSLDQPRPLYVAISEIPQSLRPLSVLSGGACGNSSFGQPLDLVPGELVDPDLLSTFPPPYRLEAR